MAALTWLSFTLLHVEETRSLTWSLTTNQIDRGHHDELCALTINCHVGQREVISDIVAQHPDIVFLQESPDRNDLAELASRLFGDEGDLIASSDCSIVARGTLEEIPSPRSSRFVHALWNTTAGRQVNVFSVRLSPATVRVDYWNPGCWQAHTKRRQQQVAEVQSITERIDELEANASVLLGGDFNCPASDRATWPLAERMDDVFESTGRGWGNTITRDYPFHRIDRIWCSDDWQLISSSVAVTDASDHRIVVSRLQPR